MSSYHSDVESSSSSTSGDRYETEYSKLFRGLAAATPSQFAEMLADDAQRIKLNEAFLTAANHERDLRRLREEYLILYEEETDLLNLNDQLLKEKAASEQSKTPSKSGGARKSPLKTSPKDTLVTPPTSSPVPTSSSSKKTPAKRAPASSSKPATKKHEVIGSTPIRKNQKAAPKEKSRQLLVTLEELLAIRTNVTDDDKAKFAETDKLKVRFRITPTEIAALQLIRPVKTLNRKPKGVKELAVADEEVADEEVADEEVADEEVADEGVADEEVVDEEVAEDEVDGEEIGAQLDEVADEGDFPGNDESVVDDSDDEMTDIDEV